MKKDLGIIFGLFLLVIVLLVFGGEFTSTAFLGSSPSNAQSSLVATNTKVTIKNLVLDATVASKVSDRRKGLSRRDSLPLNSGMLFVFDLPSKTGIWMKDMRFAIDIIWLDENKRIVDIVTNAPPQPGKKDSELTIYRPRGDAKYVLEINAGLALLNNLQIGDVASFSL